MRSSPKRERKRRKTLDIARRKDYNTRINPKALREKITAPPESCQRADGTGCNRPQEKEECDRLFQRGAKSPPARHRYPPQESGSLYDPIRVEPWDIFVSPRLFSSQEESSRFCFTFGISQFINLSLTGNGGVYLC